MPRTFGDALVHQSHFDYVVPINRPLPAHGGGAPHENEKKIGQLIASNLIDDGATLQMGESNFGPFCSQLYFYFTCIKSTKLFGAVIYH